MTGPREPIFNWPIVLYLILLAIALWPIKWFAQNLFVWFDFWPASALGIAIIAAMIAAAFAYDHSRKRRSQPLPPQEQNDSQRPEK